MPTILFILFAIAFVNSPSPDYRTEILREVNTLRKSGCHCDGEYMPPVKPVKWNDLLEQSAQIHAKDMHQYRYFSHHDRQGRDIGTRADLIGYNYRSVGENIAEGQDNVAEVIEDWLKSYEHCILMMNPKFDEMGVGRSGSVWVQHFGKRRRS